MLCRRFHLDSSYGRSRVYRRVGERFVTDVWFSGVLSVEVVSWCGVESHPMAEQLLWLWTAHLQASDTSTKSYGPMFSHLCVQQHNATLLAHVALVVTSFLIQNNVNVLPWPAMSPDMSPIEHIWDEMQRRLHGLQNQPLMLPDLSCAFVRIWNGIPQAFFRTLVASVRRRCQACIDSNGGHTRYWWVKLCLEKVSENWSLSKMLLMQ